MASKYAVAVVDLGDVLHELGLSDVQRSDAFVRTLAVWGDIRASYTLVFPDVAWLVVVFALSRSGLEWSEIDAVKVAYQAIVGDALVNVGN